MCPGLRLGFHSAKNEGGGRGARDRTLIPQHVSAEQEGPRVWQPGTGGRPEGRGWGRSPEGVRTWKRVPKACPTNRSPEVHSSDGVPCRSTSSSPLTYLLTYPSEGPTTPRCTKKLPRPAAARQGVHAPPTSTDPRPESSVQDTWAAAGVFITAGDGGGLAGMGQPEPTRTCQMPTVCGCDAEFYLMCLSP